MISLGVFLAGLGSVMLVLGYLTAKIRNIEEFNYALYKKINPPKFKEFDVVMFGDVNIVKCVVKDVKFNKNTKKYHYKIINVNNFETYHNVEETELEKFFREEKEDTTTNEDDVS